jgi:hypothetical protein
MAFDNRKIGAIVGLVGSVILMVVGFYGVSIGRMIYSSYPDYPIFMIYITSLVTLVLSAFGVAGSVLVFRDHFWGYIFLIAAGIVGIIGSFIPIYSYYVGYGYFIYNYLNNTALYTDLALMVVGGILGFGLKEKREVIVKNQ